MPPLPVIPFCWRIRLDWDTVNGVKPVNIFHVSGPWETAGEVDVDLRASYDADMWACVSSSWAFFSHSITPLDGVTATQSFPVNVRNVGLAAGQSIVNCSGMVEMQTLVRGSRGRGRNFLGPTTENVNTGTNTMDSTVRLATQGGWRDFQAALLALAGGGGSLVVASYVHGTIAPVQQITVDTLLRSTKSRLNQITQ